MRRMVKVKMEIRVAIFFLLLGSVLASHRNHNSRDSDDTDETKFKPRYSSLIKAPHTYILEPEDEQYHHHHVHHGGNHHSPKGGQASEYVDSEENVAQKENEEAVGDENLDKNVKEDDYNDHSEKAAHQGFQAGGISFDKHLKDHKADNKEVDNVKAHDAEEKFGGKALKEHKLGKHKEKSKGHKLHGFKNTYHKEEYGDHKTFHDEFLDSDHQHNYDDQHEHKEMEGGKLSKAFKHEGKNKKFDKGDEKREWGKEEFDGAQEGKHEKGGQSSKHRHGSKKHQGRYDANKQKNKNSVHKVSKGTPPPHTHHVGHNHGPHQAQIQPYVSHYNQHQQDANVPHQHNKPHVHHQSHHVQYEDNNDESNKNYGGNDYHDSSNGHGNQYHDSTSHDDNHENDADHGIHSNLHHHSGHHDHGLHKEYSHDDSDEKDSSYEERAPRKHHHKSRPKERLTTKNNDKVIQKHEPVVFKQPVSTHYGIPSSMYRQNLYQEEPKYKHPEPTYREKFSSPFEDKYNQHRIRYGFDQPRNHAHHSHHQHQPFPRFAAFNHHPYHNHAHHNHAHHFHGGHDHHFRPVQPTGYVSASTANVEPQKVVSISSTPETSHQLVSQRQYQ